VNIVNAAKPILLAFSLLCAGNAPAQRVEKEPAAIVELGGATDWSITEGGSSFGPTFAVEVTPIENWLELEAGVTPLFRHHSTEWGIDLLFKKPWTLSKKVEFMAGIGRLSRKLRVEFELPGNIGDVRKSTGRSYPAKPMQTVH
jgi:hypothetical protein